MSTPVAIAYEIPLGGLWFDGARLGVRASGEFEVAWRALIPEREIEPGRIERDIFAMGLWLQEQEFDDALATFGGRLQNAVEIQCRESLRSMSLRRALARWFGGLPPAERERLIRGREFVAIAKALRQRWPSRGPGSAKRPAHYSDDDLEAELRRVLAGFIDRR